MFALCSHLAIAYRPPDRLGPPARIPPSRLLPTPCASAEHRWIRAVSSGEGRGGSRPRRSLPSKAGAIVGPARGVLLVKLRSPGDDEPTRSLVRGRSRACPATARAAYWLHRHGLPGWLPVVSAGVSAGSSLTARRRSRVTSQVAIGHYARLSRAGPRRATSASPSAVPTSRAVSFPQATGARLQAGLALLRGLRGR